jgi:type I restriction enzyme S subunit
MNEIEVPKDWKLVKLGDIGEYKYGYNGKASSDKNQKPYLRITDINEDGSLKPNRVYVHISNNDFQRYNLKNNDVVIARTGATVGKSFLFKGNDDFVFASYLIRFRFDIQKIIPKFLLYVLKSPKYWNFIGINQSVSAQPNVNATKMSNFEFLLPSLETQKKIVQKLDHIFAQLEEKKKIILELQTSKIKHIKILSDKTIGNIISKLMHLDSSPDSWDIQKIEHICQDIQPGFAEGKKDVKDGVIHLRMNNIGTNFDLNFDLIRTIEVNKDQLKKYQLKQGDVVFNNTNSSKLVGKSAIFNDSKICLYSNHLTRLRVKKELVLPEWLLFYFRARWLNGDFERMCNKWINQAAVNNNKIKNLEIPVPNLEIQKKIVESLSNVSKNIEAIRTISESILKQEKINLNHFQNLSSKILDVAFSGKLVN